MDYFGWNYQNLGIMRRITESDYKILENAAKVW